MYLMFLLSIQLCNLGFTHRQHSRELIEVVHKADILWKMSMGLSLLVFVFIAIDHFVRNLYWVLKGALILNGVIVILLERGKMEENVVLPYTICLVLSLVMFGFKK
jgi:hypothetical protein